MRGAAIYVSSLQRCAWTEKFPHRNRSEALRWSSRFVYKNNFLITEAMNGSDYDIATDTIGFHVNSTNENSPVKVFLEGFRQLSLLARLSNIPLSTFFYSLFISSFQLRFHGLFLYEAAFSFSCFVVHVFSSFSSLSVCPSA